MTPDQLTARLIPEIESAKQQVAEERLSGNIVKENYAKGVLTGLRIALSIIQEQSNDN